MAEVVDPDLRELRFPQIRPERATHKLVVVRPAIIEAKHEVVLAVNWPYRLRTPVVIEGLGALGGDVDGVVRLLRLRQRQDLK